MNQKKSFIFILIILLTINIFSLNRLETIEKNKIKRESKKPIRNFIKKSGIKNQDLSEETAKMILDALKENNFYLYDEYISFLEKVERTNLLGFNYLNDYLIDLFNNYGIETKELRDIKFLITKIKPSNKVFFDIHEKIQKYGMFIVKTHSNEIDKLSNTKDKKRYKKASYLLKKMFKLYSYLNSRISKVRDEDIQTKYNNAKSSMYSGQYVEAINDFKEIIEIYGEKLVELEDVEPESLVVYYSKAGDYCIVFYNNFSDDSDVVDYLFDGAMYYEMAITFFVLSC